MTLGCVLLLNFWKSLRSIGIINSSLLGRIPLWSYPVLDFCLQGVFIFNMIESISLLVTSLFILPMSSWLSFGRLYVSRDLSTSSRLSNLFFLIFSYEFLYFCGINCYFSSLISYFVDLGPLLSPFEFDVMEYAPMVLFHLFTIILENWTVLL